jgi:hypothetical protein
MKVEKGEALKSLMLETDLVEQAIHRAAVRAIDCHKRLGQPIVVWRDGKVVWIPAEEIEVPRADLQS